MSTTEYNTASRAAFKAACQLPDEELGDADAVLDALPWLKDWRQNLMTNAVNNWRDKGTLKRHLMQEMEMVTAYVRLISLLVVAVD